LESVGTKDKSNERLEIRKHSRHETLMSGMGKFYFEILNLKFRVRSLT
jgi:hypothetical protein